MINADGSREKTDKKAELLAPAGNMEAFFGAIHAGADAVYLGGDRFSARAYADNFTREQIAFCIRYAHIWGRRVYLTLNTLIKESESDQIVPYLLPLYEAGLDGVIVQDIGVLRQLREFFPGMEIHASTQMTLTSVYGAEYLKRSGAIRIVPARELSLEEITYIKQKTGLEIEAFIHGAMCYCYSGQCLFSSILGGRSGNRGRCAQPCRLPYRVQITDKKGERTGRECYPLSLKDMCTIEHIPEMIDAGIDSFKIEGRMKHPEYAAGVTAIYRKYIDLYYENRKSENRKSGNRETDRGEAKSKKAYSVSGKDLKQLSSLYIRSERQDGYLFRHNGADMVTLTDPSYSGTDEELIREIRQKYIENAPKMPVKIKAQISVGAPLELCWELPQKQIKIVVQGDVVTPALKQPVTEENVRKQLGKLGDTVFEATNMEVSIEGEGFYSLKALNELRREAVQKLENALIVQNGFLAERRIENSVRNGEGVPCSKNIQSIENVPDSDSHINIDNNNIDKSRKTGLHVLVRTGEQLRAVLKFISDAFGQIRVSNAQPESQAAKPRIPDRLYIESDVVVKLPEAVFTEMSELMNTAKKSGRNLEFVMALPQIIRRRDEGFLDKLLQIYAKKEIFDGFLIRSMDGLGFVRGRLDAAGAGAHSKTNADAKLDADVKIYTDAGFYIWNGEALLEAATAQPDGFCLPYELKARDQHRLLDRAEGSGIIGAEKIIYGYIPLMHTANCVFRTTEGCDKNGENKICYLIDRYHKKFPVVKNCEHCFNTIYNCVPLSLHKELSGWRRDVDFRMDLSIEKEEETAGILNYFMNGAKGKPPFEEYTLGHEKRGAE